MRTSKRNKNKYLAKKTVAKYKKLNAHNSNPAIKDSSAIEHLNQMANTSLKNPSTPRRSHISYPFTHRNTRTVIIILSCYIVFSLWIMQNSVNAYYLQTYHHQSPLVVLNQWSIWRWGGYVGDALHTWRNYMNQTFSNINKYSVEQYNKNIRTTEDIINSNKVNDITIDKKTIKPNISNINNTKKDLQTSGEISSIKINLTANDEIFFAGDSMMQGIAPHLQKNLQQYNIKSINLSKQSTGLSYPNFFNWPETIKDTFKNNPKIKVLIILLGANDPWDIINPRTGKYIKFKSREWEQTYRNRILEILNIAKQNQAKVIWISPPNMKKSILNQHMVYLNQVMYEEIKLHDVIWIDSRPLVGGKNNIYSDYLIKDGKNIKMRTSDGIHFSIQGQKEMANAIQQYLNIMP